MANCKSCKRKPTRERTLDNKGVCIECIAKNTTNEINIGNDDESMGAITFGQFKDWFRVELQNAIRKTVAEEIKEVNDEITGLKRTNDELLSELKVLSETAKSKNDDVDMLKKIISEQQKFIESVKFDKIKNNAFVSGIPSCVTLQDGTESTDNADAVQLIFSSLVPTITQDDYSIIKAFEPSKPEHTRHSSLIRFESVDVKNSLLKKARTLKDLDEDDPFKKVYIKPDSTPLYRKENDRLYKEFKKLRDANKGNNDVKVTLKSGKLYLDKEIVDEFKLSNQIF